MWAVYYKSRRDWTPYIHLENWTLNRRSNVYPGASLQFLNICPFSLVILNEWMLTFSKKFPFREASWMCCCYWAKWDKIPVSWERVIFSSQNQTQIMKTMPSDSSSWYFLQMSKRWKLDTWGREKSVINLFLYLRYCGIQEDVAPVATKWKSYGHMSLKKKYYWITLKVTYWLSYSLWILEMNMYHTGTYCIKMLKREKWGLVNSFEKLLM